MFGYDYDDRGRLIGKRVPGGGITTLGYDLLDRLTSSRDARGTVVVTSYDNLDRVVSTSVLGGQMLTQHFYDRYSYAGSKPFDAAHAYSQTALSNVQGMATGTKVWGLGNASALTLITATYYDGLGRVIQTQADNHLGGVDKSSSKLDFAGRVLETKLSTQNGVLIETRQSYDPANRLKAVCQRVTDNASALANTAGQYWEPIARHNYNGIGELTRKTLGCSLQNLDYTYQMRGWLTGLNQPADLAPNGDKDFFGMSLAYDGVGNITTWSYRSGQKQGLYAGSTALSQNPLMAYSFGYDSQNRLTNASLTGGGASFSLTTGYDSNGNIQTLNRMLSGISGGPLIDNLLYSYSANSNRLAKVQDASGNAGFFNDGNTVGDDYAYDANGNLTQDKNKNISGITYNVLNLPQTVPLSSGTVSYTYTATGQKLRATFPGNKQYDYVAGLVYEGGKLEFVPTAEGRILPPGRAINPTSTTEVIANRYYRYEYQLKDHLGNLRVACRCPEITTAVTGSQLPGPGDTYPLMAVQEEQYDPWGLSLTGLSSQSMVNGNRFKFINREEQQGLGWIDLMARQYDPQTGRFTGVDPLPDTEGQESLSTYQYGWNNPVLKSDPDGKCPGCWELIASQYKAFQDWKKAPLAPSMSQYYTLSAGYPVKTQGDVLSLTFQRTTQSVAEQGVKYNMIRMGRGSNTRGRLALEAPRILTRQQAAQAKLSAAASGNNSSSTFAVTQDGKIFHSPTNNEIVTEQLRNDGSLMPNTVYTQVAASKPSIAVQNTITDGQGNIVGQVDFKNHGKNNAVSGHGHVFQANNPEQGHHRNGIFFHILPSEVPHSWSILKPGLTPSKPIGQ